LVLYLASFCGHKLSPRLKQARRLILAQHRDPAILIFVVPLECKVWA